MNTRFEFAWLQAPDDAGARAVMDALQKTTRRLTLAFEGFLKRTLTGVRHGRLYRRGSRVHVASAPGEPPAVDTGFLRNSVRALRAVAIRVSPVRVLAIGEVRVGAEYGFYLERGTRRMAARPWVRRTFDEVALPLVSLAWRLFRGYLRGVR